MKTTATLTLALITGFGALGAVAGDDRDNLSRCQAAIDEALGADTGTRLYDIRNRRSGDRLRIKVFPAEGESQMLDCWVYRDGDMSLQTGDGVALGRTSQQQLEQVTSSK